MTIQAVILVVEPPRGSSNLSIGHEATSAREFYECDRFAEELHQYTAASVTLIEDFLSHAPLQGFVLLYASADLETAFKECTEELRETLPQRLVPMAVDRTQIWQQLERYKLPVAIDYHQYFLWNRTVQSVSACALHGLQSVAERMGANITRRRGQYCTLESKPLETLPAFLIRYLEEYIRMLPSVRSADAPTLG